MRKLNRKLWRDIGDAKGQYIAFVAVIMLGVAFYVGATSASAGVEVNIEQFYSEQRLADLWINSPVVDESTLAVVRGLPGVAAADARLTASATSEGAEETGRFTLRSLPVSPSVNIPWVEAGRLPIEGEECAVDRGYAAAHRLGVGDILDVAINGGKRSLTVVGIVNSPEFLYLSASMAEFPNHEDYGALFVSEKLSVAQSNEIIVLAKPGVEIPDLRAVIADTILRDSPGVILERTQLLSWIMLDDDIRQFGQLGAVFPVIFFLVAAAIIFISMSKNVEIQRGQIGNMKALGVRNRLIGFHFISYALTTCAIGCLLGVLLGVFGLTPLIQAIFTQLYTMPRLQTMFFAGRIAACCALACLVGVIATLATIRTPLREGPAAAMRPRPPRRVKPVLFERSERFWSKLSYGRKIVLRNLSMNKSRAALSSVGIVGSVGLLLAGFAFMDCVDEMLNVKFYQMNRYDALVALSRPQVEAGFHFHIPGLAAAWGQSSLPAAFETEDGSVSTDLIGLDQDCDAIELFTAAGARAVLPVDGVLIPVLFAERYGLAVGDSLDLTLTPPGATASRVRVTIAGTTLQYLGQDIYTSFEYLQDLDVEPSIGTFFLVFDPQVDDPALGVLADDPAVRSTMTIKEMAGTWEVSITIMRTIVNVMIAASSVLALTVVYNISAINIFERRRDIATLRVLGYQRYEVRRLITNENLIITALGVLPGLGIGLVMLWFIIGYVASDEMVVPLVVHWPSVVYSVVLGLVFTVVANQFLRGKIKSIDMVESLKSVE